MSNLLYRVREWDITDWALVRVESDPDSVGEIDDDLRDKLQAVLDTALGANPKLRAQRMNEEGEWEDI